MENIRNRIDQWVNERFPDDVILMADGFEEAFLGVAAHINKPIAILDYEKCIDILVKDGASIEDAQEYFDFNVVGACMGENTPAFLFKFEKHEIS